MGHRKGDRHYFNMRNNIDTQPLAAVRGQQLELGRFRPVFSHEEKFKQVEEQDEEYIDVIGEYPSSEPEPEVLHPKAQTLLEQPPSKIYYDNIEKESSDGGFFDRDDLEDEDERNELVIDCKLLNGGGEPSDPLKKKTDLRICEPQQSQSQKFLFPPPTSSTATSSAAKEPEVVFNFTLVDTQLVYNESKLVQKGEPVISVHIPDPVPAPAPAPPVQKPPSMLQHHLQHGQQPRITSQLRNFKEVRTRPYSRLMPNDPRMSRSYRSVTSGVPVKRTVGLAIGDQLIGSRSRLSAFAPPAKSHFIIREPSVQQLPATTPTSTGNRRPVVVPSYHQPQSGVEKLPKKPAADPSIPYSSPHPPPRGYVKILPRREPPPPERPRTVTYLPVQFGFGSSVLHNLYDDQKPLDFSKDSPLWQYEAMLKGPREHQLRHGYHILNTLPIPKTPKPPLRAIRPKVVPMKRHPTLYQLRRPAPPLPRLKVPPPPPPTTVIDLVSPPVAAPAPPEPRPKPVESFRSAMQTQIDAFFVQRQKEICAALRNYSDERIDMDQLFGQLDQLEIRYNRDYLGLAGILIKRYGCRFRAKLRTDYQWPERPQDFVEYFANLRQQNDLKPRATEATLDIYRMVVGGLLEQFRASMEHFLSSNLEAAGRQQH